MDELLVAGFDEPSNSKVAVGDLPHTQQTAAVLSSGDFTNLMENSTRERTGSEGFFYRRKESPHPLLQDTSKINSKRDQISVSMHKLNTEAEKATLVLGKGVTEPIACHGSDAYDSGTMSPSPSPLSEPVFEPYVICTKIRSETSYSNDSQFSSSSNERLEPLTECQIDSTSGLVANPAATTTVYDPSSSSPCSDKHCLLSRQTECCKAASSTWPENDYTDYAEEEEEEGRAGKEQERVTLLISPNHNSPQLICRTKPVLPPNSEGPFTGPDDPPASPLFFPSVNPLQSTRPISSQSSIRRPPPPPPPPPPSSAVTELYASLCRQRSQRVSFHQCKAGEEGGKFSADYLGMKEVDMYIKSINSVAKELAMSQRPKDIQVFVSSERIRLAPPNSPTLFRSLLVKDILLVRKCSKNYRIIGIMVWKKKMDIPCCHIIRCQDSLVAASLYDAIWKQTQQVDDVSYSKGNQVPRPLSNELLSSDDSSSQQDSSSSSATEFLHKFSAVYIGSVPSGKSHNMDAMIDKVLMEMKPSMAKFVAVSLSLLEVRFVEERKAVAGDQDVEDEVGVFLSHDTSRIRSVGAYGADKRFAGYIMKEEGKPMTGHVIKCNSAALMVSVTSFLRQSCQLTSHQRGGAFYEELSTDESGDWEGTSFENSVAAASSLPSDNSGLAKRLRSLTTSISHLTSPPSSSPSFPSPSFQSHMSPTTITSSPPSSFGHRDPFQIPPVVSPHDFNEEEYAKFPVTYIGSASQESVLTQQSIEDALGLFASEGTAAGQAAVVKNTVHLQVSSLGINLTDKTGKLFIHRNYPRKTLRGFCHHPTDSKVFAFASERPGFANVKKVHMFRCGVESVEQIFSAMEYWLKMSPTKGQ